MKILKRHKAERDDIADLMTYRGLPSSTVAMGQIDPFLFLNHHGPQTYPAHNSGLPFAPHPHRGFETVTYIRKGELVHRDSGGYESRILTGGIQWMTAGSGLIHEEVSSDEFKKLGGELEILQLWVNLPKQLKMTPPQYKGMQHQDINSITLEDGKVQMTLLSGEWLGQKANYQSLTEIQLAVIDAKANSRLDLPLPKGERLFFYILEGEIKLQGETFRGHELLEFSELSKGDLLSLDFLSKSCLLIGTGSPTNEPIFAYGPFVMNTEADIRLAISDYQAGKFGRWQH